MWLRGSEKALRWCERVQTGRLSLGRYEERVVGEEEEVAVVREERDSGSVRDLTIARALRLAADSSASASDSCGPRPSDCYSTALALCLTQNSHHRCTFLSHHLESTPGVLQGAA